MKKNAAACLFSLTFIPWLPFPALADVPDDKTGRIQEFQERIINLREDKNRYFLTQHEKPVGDDTLARLSGDQEAIGDLSRSMRWRQATQLSIGLLGIPFGGYAFYDNIYGYGTKRTDNHGKEYAPPSRLAPFPPGSFGSYLLALAGGMLAFYGGSLLTEWGAERLGFQHPNLLGLERAKTLQTLYQKNLLDELALAPGDVATDSAIAQASGSASTDLPVPAGTEGSAAFALRKAISTLETQRGKGFKLYFVSGAVKDWNATSESWSYLFAHVERPERFKVTVPSFGAPSVTRTSDEEEYIRFQGQLTDLVKAWKIDSPKALETLKDAFAQRGVPFFDSAELSLYPYYQPSQLADQSLVSLSPKLAQSALRPLWIAEAKGVRLAVDATSGALIPFDKQAIQQEGR